ncbi:energy-dependent translational throttle protein EttA, partial [Pseudomonas aeruginosa]
FPGTVMVVSHDRWYLDRIATHILSFEDEQPEFYTGNYTEFVAYRRAKLGDGAQPHRKKYKKISG